ncbi:MAG: hypothetical protein JXR63_03950 [Spirochaetales bacterium]|nr:hypothetical protein [Spirochaetales bacterium]
MKKTPNYKNNFTAITERTKTKKPWLVLFSTLTIFSLSYANQKEYIVGNSVYLFTDNGLEQIYYSSSIEFNEPRWRSQGWFLQNINDYKIFSDGRPVVNLYNSHTNKIIETEGDFFIVNKKNLLKIYPQESNDNVLQKIQLVKIEGQNFKVIDEILFSEATLRVYDNIFIINEDENKEVIKIYTVDNDKIKLLKETRTKEEINLPEWSFLIDNRYLAEYYGSYYLDIFTGEKSYIKVEGQFGIRYCEGSKIFAYLHTPSDKTNKPQYFIFDIKTQEIIFVNISEFYGSPLARDNQGARYFRNNNHDSYPLYKFDFESKKFKFIVDGFDSEISGVQEYKNKLLIATQKKAYIYDLEKKQITGKFSISSEIISHTIVFTVVGDDLLVYTQEIFYR